VQTKYDDLGASGATDSDGEFEMFSSTGEEATGILFGNCHAQTSIRHSRRLRYRERATSAG